MDILVCYSKSIDKENSFNLLAIYTDNYSLEKKTNFKPKNGYLSREEHKNFIETNPYVFAHCFDSSINTDLDEESFVNQFSKKIKVSIEEYGDEKVITALSISEPKNVKEI